MADTADGRDERLGEAEGRLKFMHTVEKLKTQKRAGWVREGVDGPESISDHMYRMSVLALLSEDEDLDVAKCVQLAIVHDLAEAEVGDITPLDNVPRAEKQRRELEAMDNFTNRLLSPDSAASKRIRRLWQEYEDGVSKEARFVKDLDRFELALQAVEYERRTRLDNLQEFFQYSVPKVASPEVAAWANTLMDERLELHGREPFAKHFSDVRPAVATSSRQPDAGRTTADDLGMAGSAATPS